MYNTAIPEQNLKGWNKQHDKKDRNEQSDMQPLWQSRLE